MIMKHLYGVLLSNHVKPYCDPPALLAYQPDELPDGADVSLNRWLHDGMLNCHRDELDTVDVLHNRTHINCQGSCMYLYVLVCL